MRLYHSILLAPLVVFFISGCTSSKINLSEYNENIPTKLELDETCKALYTKEKSSIAVVNFTNNSNFGVADVSDKNEEASAYIGISIVGAGAAAKSSSSKTTRVVDPKLANSFIPLIEQMLINTGGVELFTRSDFDKVDAELKLQDSGLLDPDSVVDFGQTSGVKYLVTGSIDYVDHNHKDYSKYTGKLSNATKYSDDDGVKIAAAALDFATGFFDGTTIKTAVTVKVLDVATGKIIFSKQIKNETKINTKKPPSYGQLVGAIKNNISQALPTLQKQFTGEFGIGGYISQVKYNSDQEAIVQINLGLNDDIKQGDKFIVKNLESSTDPLTNKSRCETIPTNIELEATEHITNTHTWTQVIEGEQSNIKLLQLVERK